MRSAKSSISEVRIAGDHHPGSQFIRGFFNRELIYIAISRARDICITVGQWGALEQAAARIGNNRRITRLAELIKGGPDNDI